jgi:hypothetical protein
VEFAEYDDMMRRMLAIVARMDSAIDELKGFNRQQGEINERLTAAIERIDTVLQRLIRGSGDGREA